MNKPEWNNINVRAAWFLVYQDLQAKGEEYYFNNANGFLRCHADALAGKEPGPTHWAMFVAERMKL